MLVYFFTTLVYLLCIPYDINNITITNVFKLLISTVCALLVIYSKNINLLVKSLTYPIYFFAFSVIILDWSSFLDIHQKGVNYLTLTMPVAIAAAFILFKIFFHSTKLWTQVVNLALFGLLFSYLLLSGSRSAILIVLILAIIFTFIIIVRFSFFIMLVYFISILGIFFYLFYFIVPEFLEVNNFYLYSRIYLNSASVDNNLAGEMSRSQLYSMVLSYIFDGNIFGYGVGATHSVLAIQYVESYFLELLLNYGILFGSIFIFFFHFHWFYIVLNLRYAKYNFYLFNIIILCFCNFMFFIKGWGLYDFSGQLILISLLVSFFAKIKYRERNEVYNC